jgi:TetR/AcrR family transcriptional repressor of nem operon
MRYGPEHKLETHQKIVKDASRRVRAEGLSGAAVSAIMKDAGLTHGGFYKHFRSKDDLLLESLREGFGKSRMPWFMPLNSRRLERHGKLL